MKISILKEIIFIIILAITMCMAYYLELKSEHINDFIYDTAKEVNKLRVENVYNGRYQNTLLYYASGILISACFSCFLQKYFIATILLYFLFFWLASNLFGALYGISLFLGIWPLSFYIVLKCRAKS